MKMANIIAKTASVLAFLTLTVSGLSAEQVKKLDFTGITRTEQVVIKIDENEQTMEYMTPSRSTKYKIVDYDVSRDSYTGNRVLKATAVDMLFNTAQDVLLCENKDFYDIRIGKKRLTFSLIKNFNIERE